MKIFFISATVFFLINANSVYAQHNRSQFKIAGGKPKNFSYYIAGGDTVYDKYEVSDLEMDGADSILLVEKFDSRKEWFLYRYKIQDGQPKLAGWQQEFDINGVLQNERYCDLGSRHCDVMKRYNYYPGGQLSSIVSYRKNRYDGYTWFYYSNGQLRQCIEYKDGRPWNVQVYYDQNGVLLDAGDFKDGNGTLNVYSMNGIMIQKKIFVNGKLKKKIEITSDD